ncbi:DDE-type integrase/transposase/recombinase, partial [Parabacteroides acidifaciens]
MCKSYFKDKFTMGRDAFYNLLRDSGFMLRIKRRKARTTYADPYAPLYPNLIKGVVPTAANQVWVSDITYIWTLNGFCYLFLITDLYSHRIMGWTFSSSLKYKNAQETLEQAIK